MGSYGAPLNYRPTEHVMDQQPAAPEHREDTLVEPRAITGNGPQGIKWAIGRGDLTPRQQERLLRYVEFHRRFGREEGTIEP
jgi:hypothetical protein